jgi:hypothetical protein
MKQAPKHLPFFNKVWNDVDWLTTMKVLKDLSDPRSGPCMHTLVSSSYRHRLLEKLISPQDLCNQSHILEKAIGSALELDGNCHMRTQRSVSRAPAIHIRCFE